VAAIPSPPSLPDRIIRWMFTSIVFSIIPLAIAYFSATPHLVNIATNHLVHISSVAPSLYEILSTGSLYLVAASMSGGAVVALFGTGKSWLWAKTVVGGTAASVVFFCASFYSDVLSSVTVDQDSVGVRSLILFFTAAATGLGAVFLAEI
jgi:hypothetical protein